MRVGNFGAEQKLNHGQDSSRKKYWLCEKLPGSWLSIEDQFGARCQFSKRRGFDGFWEREERVGTRNEYHLSSWPSHPIWSMSLAFISWLATAYAALSQ